MPRILRVGTFIVGRFGPSLPLFQSSSSVSVEKSDWPDRMCETWKVPMWRHVVATVLGACFVASLCRPLLNPSPEASIPACCRRDGKHHCAAMASYLAQERSEPDGKPRFNRAPEQCPYRLSTFAPTAPQSLGSSQSPAFYTSVERQLGILPFAEVRAHAPRSRSHFRRGPPALL